MPKLRSGLILAMARVRANAGVEAEGMGPNTVAGFTTGSGAEAGN